MNRETIILLVFLLWSAIAGATSFSIEWTQVSCPDSHDGEAWLTLDDPDINYNDFDWEIISESPNVDVLSLSDGLLVRGLDYLGEHCILFTADLSEPFSDTCCLTNDQLADQSLYENPEVFSGAACPDDFSGLFLINYEDPPALSGDFLGSFDYTFFNLTTQQVEIPDEITVVSSNSVIINGLPAGEYEVICGPPDTACSYSYSATMYGGPDEPVIEPTLEIIEQDAEGATVIFDVAEANEDWGVNMPVNQFLTLPAEIYIPNGELLHVNVCPPQMCCQSFDLVVPIYGCTDSESCDYFPEADFDDGSCQYGIDCGDFDGDGVVGTDDLLDFLTNFGQFGTDLGGDFNGDGIVNSFDLILFLILFGG